MNGIDELEARRQRAVVLAEALDHPGVLLRHDLEGPDDEDAATTMTTSDAVENDGSIRVLRFSVRRGGRERRASCPRRRRRRIRPGAAGAPGCRRRRSRSSRGSCTCAVPSAAQAATWTRSPMSRLTSRSRARRQRRPGARDAAPVPERGRAAADDCRDDQLRPAAPRRSGRRARRPPRPMRDHQQVEGPGGELDGDGDAGRRSTTRWHSRGPSRLRSVVRTCQCMGAALRVKRRASNVHGGPRRPYTSRFLRFRLREASPMLRFRFPDRHHRRGLPLREHLAAWASARSPRRSRRRAWRCSASPATATCRSSRSSRAARRRFILSIDDEEFSAGPGRSTRRCCNLRKFIEEIRFKNAEIPIYLYGETRTSRHIPNDILRELHGFIHMFEDTPEFVARHIIREAQQLPRRRSRRRSSARWSTTRRTARTRGTARATRAASRS